MARAFIACEKSLQPDALVIVLRISTGRLGDMYSDHPGRFIVGAAGRSDGDGHASRAMNSAALASSCGLSAEASDYGASWLGQPGLEEMR